MSDDRTQQLKDFAIQLYSTAPCLIEDLLPRVNLSLEEITEAIETSGIHTWGKIRLTAEKIDYSAFEPQNITTEIRAYMLGLIYCLGEPCIDIRGKKIVYLELDEEYGYCINWLFRSIRTRRTLNIPFNTYQVIFEDDDFYELILSMYGADEARFPQLPYDMRRHFFRAYFDITSELTITTHVVQEKKMTKPRIHNIYSLRVFTTGQRFTYDFISALSLILQPTPLYVQPRTVDKTIGEYYLHWLTRDRIVIILYLIYHDSKYHRLSKYEEAKEFVENNHLYKRGILTDPDFFIHTDGKVPVTHKITRSLELDGEAFDDELEDF